MVTGTVILFLVAVLASHLCSAEHSAEHGNVNIRASGGGDHLRSRVRQNTMLERDPDPDPKCERGIRSSLICCHPECAKCGGKGCGIGRVWKFCCKGSIWRSERYCMEVGPPCIIRARKSPSPSSSSSATSSASQTPTPSTTLLTEPSPTPSSTPVPNTAPPPTTATTPTTQTSDPYCMLGIESGTACCPEACGACGGDGCGTFGPNGEICCSGKINNEMPPCTETLPPCVIVEVPPPSPVPVEDGSKWEYVTGITGSLTPRHEACFIFVDGKGYLIGGRGQTDPVDVFDPVTKTWTQRAGYGEKIHHMQCVAHDCKVWIPSSWTAGYPYETNHKHIIIYDTVLDTWSTLPGLPDDRLRGGAASVLHDGKIYVVGGNRGGHGAHAMTLGWMDYYDLSSGQWTSNLPELPEARDHVGGAMVNGRLCIAGGRNSGVSNFFNAAMASVWCFDFGNMVWVRGDDLEVPRAGAATATVCDGRLMIAGGETTRTTAWERVDLFDGDSWTRAPDLNRGRHGSGLGVSDCTCAKVFVASGSGNKGGSPELDSTEVYTPGGGVETCVAF